MSRVSIWLSWGKFLEVRWEVKVVLWYRLGTGPSEGDTTWHSFRRAWRPLLPHRLHWFCFSFVTFPSLMNGICICYIWTSFMTSDTDIISLDICIVFFINCPFTSFAYFFTWVSALFGDINLFYILYPSCMPLNVVYHTEFLYFI